MTGTRISPLDQRYLDPASSLAEVLFGLIMTLTFTLGAGIIIEDEGREGARQLLIALIGCNIAWGVIDAALFLVDTLFDRGRLRRVGLAVQRAPDERAAVSLVAGELDELLEDLTSESEREELYRRIADNVRRKVDRPKPLGKDDWMGAFTSFWLVVITSAPAAIPFLLFDDARFALRISNSILLASLFVIGFWWARHAHGRPWLVGSGLLAGGTALVGVAILLGG